MFITSLSAAQVEESRSSAAGSSRAWRADGSRPSETRRRSGLVLTRLPKPCDTMRDRAEERAWWAGTQTLQESCARRALVMGRPKVTPHTTVDFSHLTP